MIEYFELRIPEIEIELDDLGINIQSNWTKPVYKKIKAPKIKAPKIKAPTILPKIIQNTDTMSIQEINGYIQLLEKSINGMNKDAIVLNNSTIPEQDIINIISDYNKFTGISIDKNYESRNILVQFINDTLPSLDVEITRLTNEINQP